MHLWFATVRGHFKAIDMLTALQMTGDVGAGDLYTLWGGTWDPHDPNRICTAGGNGVQVSHVSQPDWQQPIVHLRSNLHV